MGILRKDRQNNSFTKHCRQKNRISTQIVDEVKAFPLNPRPAGRAVAGTVYRAHLRLRLRCTRLLEIGVLAGRHICDKAIGEETLLKNQTARHLRLGCFPRFPCFPPRGMENRKATRGNEQ